MTVRGILETYKTTAAATIKRYEDALTTVNTQAATIKRLQQQIATADEVEEDERERQAQCHSDALKYKNEEIERLRRAVNEAPKRAQEPYARKDFEAMKAPQLRSFIEEAINEARRKGMLEAEGLVSRHRGLSNQTDLEMLRGMVRNYQERITALELDLKVREKAKQVPVKLDTRPLVDKLSPETKSALGSFDQNGTWRTVHPPAWWRTQLTTEERVKAEVEERRNKEEATRRCWCGYPLVRGQCEVHTLNWQGNEHCVCGRMFATCIEPRNKATNTAIRHVPRLLTDKFGRYTGA